MHAADNAFAGWPAFNEMIGIGAWRGRTEKAGPFWYFQDGKLVSDPRPARRAAGTRMPFAGNRARRLASDHRGLPAVWMHQGDELRAPARPGEEHDGARHGAVADDNAGTGRDEPC